MMFPTLITPDRIPRSAALYNEILEAARAHHDSQSQTPSDVVGLAGKFPHRIVMVRNTMPLTTYPGASYQIGKAYSYSEGDFLERQVVFPLLLPELGCTSWATPLSPLRPNEVGPAALHGWIGHDKGPVYPIRRRYPKRAYGISSIAGPPYIHPGPRVFTNYYSRFNAQNSWIGVNRQLVSNGFDAPDLYYGMESLQLVTVAPELLRLRLRCPIDVCGSILQHYFVDRRRQSLSDAGYLYADFGIKLAITTGSWEASIPNACQTHNPIIYLPAVTGFNPSTYLGNFNTSPMLTVLANGQKLFNTANGVPPEKWGQQSHYVRTWFSSHGATFFGFITPGQTGYQLPPVYSGLQPEIQPEHSIYTAPTIGNLYPDLYPGFSTTTNFLELDRLDALDASGLPIEPAIGGGGGSTGGGTSGSPSMIVSSGDMGPTLTGTIGSSSMAIQSSFVSGSAVGTGGGLG